MEIKNVIICGLGALGLTYANKLVNKCNLKILANSERIAKYISTPPIFNDKELFLDYITPAEKFDADLIIITTKSTGLDSAIEYIKNFVTEKTLIFSLVNGISSEELIAASLKKGTIIRSFFIGHSAIRTQNKTTQDGVGKIVLEPNKPLENFFTSNNIDYEISKDIIYSQWVKLGVNIILNEPSAIYEMTVGEMKKQQDYSLLAQNLIKEVKEVALKLGIKGIENFEKDVFDSVNLVSDSGTTSMYQDIMAKRKTEIEIFSGEIIKLGKKLNINTPFNQKIYDMIIEKERSFL